MSRMTWRDKATDKMISQKINRQRNPVTTYTQLATELGAPVYPNHSGGGPAPSSTFRQHVRDMTGKTNIFA